MKLHFISLVFCGLLNIANANDQMRNWTFMSGEKKQAEIVSYDEAEKKVTLRLVDSQEVKYSEDELSAIDRAWVLQWVEQDEEARALLAKLGGKVTTHAGTGKFKTEYAVYHPPAAAEGKKLPMLILFHPGGNGQRAIYKYVEAAAAAGMTLVSLDYFRNEKDPDIQDQMLECFNELLPQIEATVPHDENRIFMGGTSGGACRAYHYSAKVKRPWAGILACGGWLGGRGNYDMGFPRMRVAMVNGDKDNGANPYIAPDSDALRKTGSVISVHAFEGGHQMPPPSVLEKAMRWLLSNEGEPQAGVAQ